MTLFQGFWHGPSLGPLRQACLASFVAMEHSFDLYVYEAVTVPKGIRLRDANEVIPLSEVFYFDNPISQKLDIGPFSDLFRFKLLFERGGWWSDVDAICLAQSIPAVERAWAREKPLFDPNAIGTSQIAFSRHDPIVRELYRRCLKRSKSGFTSREALGPALISDTLSDLGLPPDEFGTTKTFYPVQWIEMFKLWLPEFRGEILERSAGAYFMPIYASFPQYIGLEFGRLPPEGSFLSDICYRYLDGRRKYQRYTSEEIRRAVQRFFFENRGWAMTELRSMTGVETLMRMGLGRELAPLLNP